MSKQQRIKQFAADTAVELVASLLCAIGLRLRLFGLFLF